MVAMIEAEVPFKERLKAGPHYRITIRPTTFNELLIPTRDVGRRTVRDCQVRLRLHTFPDFDNAGLGITYGEDFVEFGEDWSYWRYYHLSG